MRRLLAATVALAAAAAHAEGSAYLIDPTHTSLLFEIAPRGIATLRGRFDRKEGMVQFDRAGRSGRVELTFETASVNTGVATLDRLLQGKDFFNAGEFPSGRFVADGFAFSGDQVSAVTGTLTLLGQAHPVTLKASNFGCYTNPLFRREVCGGDFETTIQRSRWGIVSGLAALAPDSVRLLVQVEAIKQ